MKELTVAQAPARKFPWWIVAIAAVVVLGAGVITWLLIPQRVAMPNVVGKSLKDAEKSLGDAKLKPAKETKKKVTGTQKPGTVIEQSPTPGPVRVGSEVQLVVEVAPQTISVPKIVGESVEDAKELLTDLVYEQVGEKITGKFSPGVVVEQNPARGTKVPPGTKVAAFVEAESVQVPDLIGQSPAQVRAGTLESAAAIENRSEVRRCKARNHSRPEPKKGRTRCARHGGHRICAT